MRGICFANTQTSVYVVRNTTSDVTPTELFPNGTAGVMVVPSDAVWKFHALVVGTTSTGATAGTYELSGAIKNIGGVLSLIGVVTQTAVHEDAGAAAWDATAIADNVDLGLAIQVTGAAATDIRWVARVETAQVVYP